MTTRALLAHAPRETRLSRDEALTCSLPGAAVVETTVPGNGTHALKLSGLLACQGEPLALDAALEFRVLDRRGPAPAAPLLLLKVEQKLTPAERQAAVAQARQARQEERTLGVRLVDHDSGEPLTGVDLMVQRLNIGGEPRRGRTDGRGRVTFHGLGPGEVRLWPASRKAVKARHRPREVMGYVAEDGEVGAWAAHIKRKGKWRGAEGEVEFKEAFVKASGKADASRTHVEAKGKAEASLLAAKARGFVNTGKGNSLAVEGEAKLASAHAEAEGFVGNTDKMAGFKAEGDLEATAAAASVAVEAETTYHIPFTNWTVKRKSKLSLGASKGVGFSAGAHAYYDKKKQQFHFGGGLSAAFLGALGFSDGFTVSKRYKGKSKK